jgi:CelD/BcsL family acetyltransferase involved in cellulose biosynthesis
VAWRFYPAVITVRVTSVSNFDDLGVRWRALERRSNGSFFQCWTWVGCLADERFTDPVLVEAVDGDQTIALALFNRVHRWIGPDVLFLGESGMPEIDCPYVEQNGVLTEAGRENELTALCLGAVTCRYDLVLSGMGQVPPGGLIQRSHASPYVDLTAIRANRSDYLSTLSANTRQQIRRSNRFYEKSGLIVVEHAESVASAHAMLDEMAILHQAAWTARGQPGSFAQPFFRRFHRALIEVGLPRGEISLIKISCNGTKIGILYNFVHKGRSLVYQSGFAYQDRTSPAKPGLTCHARAIQNALDDGLEVYDFLAGDDRYKRSLADQSHQQFWVCTGPFWSPSLLLRRAVRAFR